MSSPVMAAAVVLAAAAPAGVASATLSVQDSTAAMPAVTGSAVECVDEKAAGFDCQNIGLVSFLPVEVAYFDTALHMDNTPGYGGAWSNYPYFKNGAIAVSSSHEGLFMLRFNPPGAGR